MYCPSLSVYLFSSSFVSSGATAGASLWNHCFSLRLVVMLEDTCSVWTLYKMKQRLMRISAFPLSKMFLSYIIPLFILSSLHHPPCLSLVFFFISGYTLYLLHIFFIPFHFFPSRTSHWYSAAWQLIPLTWLERLREPLWQVFQKPSYTLLSPLVSFFHLRNHFSFSSPPDTPLLPPTAPSTLICRLCLSSYLRPLWQGQYRGSAISRAQFVIKIYKKHVIF